MSRIRVATTDDADAVHDIYAPFVAETAVTFETVVPSREEMAERISETLERFPWLVCADAGDVVGYAYAHSHRGRGGYRWSAESSVYVAEGHRRRGIARGLYESLFAVLELQGHVNCYAGTVLPNERSVGFHRSMGFEPVGNYEKVGYKKGEWRDTRWFHRRLRDPPVDPEEPTAFADLRGSRACREAIVAGEESIRA